MKHGSRVTAVGIQGAGFERRAENCVEALVLGDRNLHKGRTGYEQL